MSELKPCPFCGGEADLMDAYNPRLEWTPEQGRFSVQCSVYNRKKCHVNPATGFYLQKAEAIKAWNTRQEQEQE